MAPRPPGRQASGSFQVIVWCVEAIERIRTMEETGIVQRMSEGDPWVVALRDGNDRLVGKGEDFQW